MIDDRLVEYVSFGDAYFHELGFFSSINTGYCLGDFSFDQVSKK